MCTFALINISIETSTNVCTGKPRICNVRKEPTCIVGLQYNVVQSNGLIQTIVFLLSVSARLKKMFGAFRSISGHNFYMGTQNGSKLKI